MKSIFVVCSLFLTGLAGAEIYEVIGQGSGDDFEQALVDAKVYAVCNADGQVFAQVDKDQDVKAVSNEAYLVSYEVIGRRESKFDGTSVTIRAKVSKGEPAYVLKDGFTEISGEGDASDPGEATVLALCNAVMESGARIRAVRQTEDDELVKDDSVFDARGFISSFGVVRENGKVTAKCKVCGDGGAFELANPVSVSGEGVGVNKAFAEAVARRRMLLEGGSEFDVHAAYKDGARVAFTAKRTRAAHVSSVKASLGAADGKNMAARVTAMLSSASIEPETGSTSGLGFGADVIAAREAAICDAIVNRSSLMKVTVSYDNGRETGCSTEYSGSCNYFGEDFESIARVDEGFLCEIKVKAVAALPEVAADIAQEVKTVGFGRDKSAALSDAKQRAIDTVFGSAMSVSMCEQDGRVTKALYHATHSEKGYVDKCEVVAEDASAGVTTVTIKAVVKNHDGDTAGWGWGTAVIVFFVLGAIFMGAKKIGTAALVLVWILSLVGLFASGHWAVGIAAVLLGIGAMQED